MKRVCAWCNKQMEILQAKNNDSDGLVTHSICDDCADNLDFQMGVTLLRYLDSLKIPIIALDGSGQVIAINGEAGKLQVNKQMGISANWLDKVFECAYARLPEGCKRPVHCSACAIRNITADVYRTGKSQRNVPAHFNSSAADMTEKIDMLVSADKIDGIVFLRIAKC